MVFLNLGFVEEPRLSGLSGWNGVKYAEKEVDEDSPKDGVFATPSREKENLRERGLEATAMKCQRTLMPLSGQVLT